MQERLKKIILWMKNNSGRLLLYAVILTGCFSIKYAAYGKYVDFLKDFTSVTAAPFYFSSNYLGEESESKNYVIGTFDGKEYELDVEIRNNDNSLNFNDTDKPFYYYVTAELYKDANYTDPYSEDTYSTVIKYGKNNEYAAAMARGVKDYYWATKSEEGQEVEYEVFHRNITIDNNSNKDYNKEEIYKVLGRIDGLSSSEVTGQSGARHQMANVKTEGRQTVRISITWGQKIQQSKIYLKVTAHTVPATSVENDNTVVITDKEKDIVTLRPIDKSKLGSYADTMFPTGYVNHYTGNSSFPGVLTDYETQEGIYASYLLGKFELTGNDTSGETDIKQSMSYSTVDYAVLYTFTSKSNLKVKLYYNSGVMNPDDSLGTVYYDPCTIDSKNYTNYVNVDLFANGSKSCYFYKKVLGYTPELSDVKYVISQ